MVKYKISILIILTLIISVSGCTSKTASNGTFGEKIISINLITLSNNATSGNDTYNGTEYYYIDGYLENHNSNDAYHVKIATTAYDTNGNVVATNDSVYLNPSSVPAKGVSEFFVSFPDNSRNIVRYDVKILSASGTL